MMHLLFLDITKVITAKTCQNVLQINPSSSSGAYNIYPTLNDNMQVYCDMETDNGGWIVSGKFMKPNQGRLF